MSFDDKSERSIGMQVNEVFTDVRSQTARQRIQLASFVLHDPMMQQRVALNEQLESFEQYPSNTKQSRLRIHFFGFQAFAALEPLEPPRIEPENGALFSDLEKADLALLASIDGVQATHRLTARQAKKALAQSRRSF